MTPELEEALARWESGELSRDELVRRFPDADVKGLLDTFERMQVAATGPTPDPSEAWDAVRGALPVRLAQRRRRPRTVRLLAAATLALLLMGATAYALVPGVRRALNDASGVITSDDGSPDRLTPDTGAPSHEEVGAETSSDDDPGTSADEGAEDNSGPGSDEGAEDNSGPGSDEDAGDSSGPGSDDEAAEDSGSDSDEDLSADDSSGPGVDGAEGASSDDSESSGSGSGDTDN
jgi:hypothetical protein